MSILVSKNYNFVFDRQQGIGLIVASCYEYVLAKMSEHVYSHRVESGKKNVCSTTSNNGNFVVFGAGSWGTALALHLASIGHSVILVPRTEKQAVKMSLLRENVDHFEGFILPDNICVTPDLDIDHACAIFLGCSTAGVTEFCCRIADAIGRAESCPPIISLCKGLVPETQQLPSDAIATLLPAGCCIGALSGPTYARDVALGKPTAAVLAFAEDSAIAHNLQELISSPNFRAYRTTDLRGVELGGALKNPYAIGMGIAEHFADSDNGLAALLTRMLTELARIGVALGGRHETFYGLSGLGDLVATGFGEWSRNRKFGVRIGLGENADDLILGGTTVEGYGAAKGFQKICMKNDISAPILDGICSIIFEQRQPEDILHALMCRNPRNET
jgi:glycerol-3-phosphate dehydrogenase (NAD(P)+)